MLSNKSCKHCGSTSIKIHGYHTRKIRFLDIGSYKSNIEYKQRRFKCDDCSKTFNEDTDLVKKGSTISNQTKVKVLDNLRTKTSFTDVAENLNISVTTTIKEFSEHIIDYRCKLSSTICIDEFRASTIAGEYAFIIGDPESGKILDILPSRKQDYIYYYFQTIPKDETEKVQYIVTDLFESYRTICKTIFWKSTHIADRFHWIRLTTEAFNKIRIRIMNTYLKLSDDEFKGSYNKYFKYANVLKKYHKLLLANKYSKEEWFFDQKQVASYIQKNMTFQEIIEYCLNFDSDLQESYFLLQDLYKIAKLSNYQNSRQNILEWCDKVNSSEHKIPELVKVALTYKSWLEPIINSFIINPTTKSRMTNGFIEGKNNFCKVIKRVGFGYSNFDHFRAKILYTNDPNRPYKS
jgi:transposase